MRNNILFALFFFICFGAAAQQKPYFTQYILNNYILNPAVTGIENYTDLKLSYRNQWTQMDGAPTTMYLSVHGPIGKKDYRTTPTSFAIPGENPRGKSYYEDYTAAEPHSGVGMIVMNDQTGYLRRTSSYLTYAYHRALTTRTSISAGFQAGASQMSLDRSKIEWATLDPNDPAIGYANSELKEWKPEIGAGVWVYSADYFLGASVLNIVPGKNRFTDDADYGTHYVPQWMATGGFRFFLNDDISVLPSAMAQFVQPFPVQIHGNIKVQYRDLLWAGGSYRFNADFGGFAGMVGTNISNTFNIGYAYDATRKGGLRMYTGNTHEIIIGFLLNNRYGDTCPKNIW